MRLLPTTAVLCLTSCPRPQVILRAPEVKPQLNLYESWGEQLLLLAGSGRVDNVSMLLGVPPSCSETAFDDPNGGFFVRLDEPVIIFVVPEGPASEIGLQNGVRVLEVAGVPITTGTEAIVVFGREATVGEPVRLTTSHGAFDLVPTDPSTAELEQCYWEVNGGRVATPTGAYERFFRGTCQVAGGWLVSCSSNHQF